MRVRWTTDAADDLERICDYIATSRSESARRVAQSVVERIGTLERSRVSDILVVSKARERSPFLRSPSSQSMKSLTPGTEVRVLRVLHGAQRWPAG